MPRPPPAPVMMTTRSSKRMSLMGISLGVRTKAARWNRSGASGRSARRRARPVDLGGSISGCRGAAPVGRLGAAVRSTRRRNAAGGHASSPSVPKSIGESSHRPAPTNGSGQGLAGRGGPTRAGWQTKGAIDHENRNQPPRGDLEGDRSLGHGLPFPGGAGELRLPPLSDARWRRSSCRASSGPATTAREDRGARGRLALQRLGPGRRSLRGPGGELAGAAAPRAGVPAARTRRARIGAALRMDERAVPGHHPGKPTRGRGEDGGARAGPGGGLARGFRRHSPRPAGRAWPTGARLWPWGS